MAKYTRRMPPTSTADVSIGPKGERAIHLPGF